jgi:hypothetical protein
LSNEPISYQKQSIRKTLKLPARETNSLPRLPRFCPSDIPVHVIQRGNNRQTLFTSDKDIAAYAHWLPNENGLTMLNN